MVVHYWFLISGHSTAVSLKTVSTDQKAPLRMAAYNSSSLPANGATARDPAMKGMVVVTMVHGDSHDVLFCFRSAV